MEKMVCDERGISIMKITLIEPTMIKKNDFSEKPSWQLAH
jgi:hypothetical protein